MLLPLCFAFASLTPKADEPSAATAVGNQLGLYLAPHEANSLLSLPAEIQKHIFAQLGFAGLYQTSHVSKHFHKLAHHLLMPLYGYKYAGKIFLCYSRMFRALEKLEHEAFDMHGSDKVYTVLQSSPDYMCLKLVVQAKFGSCIYYNQDSLPIFNLHKVTLDILNDVHRISALPYILDQTIDDPDWIYYICGLAELKRIDLLEQMTFPGIRASTFYQLMQAFLPESVVMNAVSSLLANEPQEQLSKALAFVRSSGQADLAPQNQQQPLFILRHLHEKSIPVPETWVFIDGLEEHSISFWMYVLALEPEEVDGLLNLVLKHGDDNTKLLASAFYEPFFASDSAMVVYSSGQVAEVDICQAMLIRFHFTFTENAHLYINYEAMLERLENTGYHTACALLDCDQTYLIKTEMTLRSLNFNFEALAVKMYRIKDGGQDLFLEHCLSKLPHAATMLKNLIKRKADKLYIDSVWRSIRKRSHDSCCDDISCYAPVEMLANLTSVDDFSVSETEEILAMQDEFEQNTPFVGSEETPSMLDVSDDDTFIDNVEELLSILDGFEDLSSLAAEELRALYTVMFWEAPEQVIWHFLGQLPEGCLLDYGHVLRFILLEKYSPKLCLKLLEHQESKSGLLMQQLVVQVSHFRPDIIKEFVEAPKLLKDLIQEGADDAMIQPVWDLIHNKQSICTADAYFCVVPPSILRRLACEQDISPDHVQETLNSLHGFEQRGNPVPKEAHALYTTMFWEAPERIVWHFFGQLPDDCWLDCGRVLALSVLPKYSTKLCIALVEKIGTNVSDSQVAHLVATLREFRPDVAKEFGLFK